MWKRIVCSNGVYEGDVINGKFHGKGKYTWTDGNMYVGDFVDGDFHGRGKFIWSNGNVYEGDYVHDERTGKGKLTLSSGDIYEGDFVHGERNGKGRYTWKNGDKYEGDFVHGVRTGKGKYTWTDGNMYVGDFVDGDFHGRGKFIWSNGNVYEGDCVHDKRTGKGKYTWKNGSAYVGEFLDGKFHGKGAEYLKDGTLIRSGTWKQDAFQPDISAVPSRYAGHYYLKSRGKGNTSLLKGNVVFLLIPVTCAKWPWTKDAEKQFIKEFYEAKYSFEKEAGRCGAKLQVHLRQFQNPKDITDISRISQKDVLGMRDDLKKEIVRQLLEMYDANNLEEVEAVLKRNMQRNENLKVDDVAFIVACNTSCRSFASTSEGKFRNEICMVFPDSSGFKHTTIMHEVCHLFGAEDYYYPKPELPQKSKKYLGENIMDCCAEKIDDLTKYIIGFTDTLSPAARAFLDATAHFTEEEIEAGKV